MTTAPAKNTAEIDGARDSISRSVYLAAMDDGEIPTYQQIRQLRAEAASAGDLEQVAVCNAALGYGRFDVVAILPDGQVCRDEAHVGAERTFSTRLAAERRCAALHADRPAGHEAVRYEVRACPIDQAWALAECARVIVAARAQEDAR